MLQKKALEGLNIILLNKPNQYNKHSQNWAYEKTTYMCITSRNYNLMKHEVRLDDLNYSLAGKVTNKKILKIIFVKR